MAAASKSSSMNIDNLTHLLQDPVGLTPYAPGPTRAVLLLPCGDVINARTAERLRICPLCRAEIQATHPVRLIDQIASEFFQRSEEPALPADSAKIPVDPEVEIRTIPFPGKGAYFELCNSGWDDVFNSGGNLIRSMKFRSRVSDSIFSEFYVLGYRDGSLSLSLKWRDKAADEYLSRCKVHLSEIARVSQSVQTHFPPDVRKLFHIVTLHNEIPEPHFGLIKRLVEAKNWKIVTPLYRS